MGNNKRVKQLMIMRQIKIILRSPLAIGRLIVAMVFTTLMYIALLLVLFVHKERPMDLLWRMMNYWCQNMLAIMGMQVDLTIEESMKEPGLILSNHRSYIDIFINLSMHSARIIAKKEIGSWPIIGLGMRVFNVLMMDRSSMSSRMENVRQMEAILINKESLIIYPEGTTHRGPGIGPIKESTYKIASKNNIRVYPIAIEYENQDDAWVGDDLFVPHFIRRSGVWHRKVSVVVGRSVQTTDNVVLKNEIEDFMTNETLRMRKEFDKNKS